LPTNTQNTFKLLHGCCWITLHPKEIDFMHETIKTYLEREHSILLSITRTLYVYQVCYGAGRCVKDGSCSSSRLEWKLTDSINGISYYLNKCQTPSNTSHITLQMHCACNTVQLLWRSRVPFSWTMPPTAPSWAHWLQDLGSHTAAWVWVVSRKDWRRQGGTSWILAMHWYSIWVKKMQFSRFPVLPGSAQVISGGIVKHLLIAYFIGNISAKKISKCIHVCQSLSKVGRIFWDTV